MGPSTKIFPASARWGDAGEKAGLLAQQRDFFRRELLQQEDRYLIKSTCRACGVVIVGSIAHTLVADEQRHLEQCSASQAFPQAG